LKKLILAAALLAGTATATATAQELTGTLKKIKDSGAITLGAPISPTLKAAYSIQALPE
jgi:hypothetical protein